MTEMNYALRNIAMALPDKLAQYLEAQYHIWDESLVSNRSALLRAEGTIATEPYIEATPAYVPGKRYDELAIPKPVAKLLADASATTTTGVPQTPYLHQALALDAFFRDNLDLVVSTGTGSGKTESFLMPILGSLALERNLRPASYELPASRALLLYPMNALVNDQMSRLRRLIASPVVSLALIRTSGHNATFGMYTSRTPYPGVETAQRNNRDIGDWIDRFFVKYQAQQARLEAEGKWPAKDLLQFRQTYSTARTDSELLTRHEMHRRPPDILVTNYSMLEYMLLRPVDAPIFSATRAWLDADPANQFIIVLDESHLYQGAQGTEVSLLLRRLISRLRVSRSRIRFILTSASLASGPHADRIVREFAAQLTGANDPKNFACIEGTLLKPNDGIAATVAETEALAALPVDSLVDVAGELTNAKSALKVFATAVGAHSAPELDFLDSAEDVRDWAYSLLANLGVAKLLAFKIMGTPTTPSSLRVELFNGAPNSEQALDGLLAVCAYARRRSDGRPFLPARAHFLFRGVAGIFACLDPNCSALKTRAPNQLLGALYSQPRLRCACGARVFELLTHRDCGAAFIRGYFRPSDPGFLWHEPSTGLGGQGQALSEVHLLVETSRQQTGSADRVWLHKKTGEITTSSGGAAFLELRRPTSSPVSVRGRSVVTFDRQCPVCRGRWSDATQPKIMDLTTKGEDPFAHLVETQVRLQPPSCKKTRHSPNAGRKSLLFSDGRQKAARLARDLPRVMEQDAFRQIILLAASELEKLGKEPRLSDPFIHVSFVSIVSSKMLRFFDGPEAQHLLDHQKVFEDSQIYDGNLRAALDDAWSPQSSQAFRMNLMKVLGSRYYSLHSLGLGYVSPRKLALSAIRADLAPSGLTDAEIDVLTASWIQGCLDDFVLYGKLAATKKARTLAAGYNIVQAGTKSGFSADQKKFLRNAIDLVRVEDVLRNRLTEQGDAVDLRLLKEGELRITSALNQTWYRCSACTYLAPFNFRGLCISCGSMSTVGVQPANDSYLRARKSFWRNPVAAVISGAQQPMTLDVQEHTAQLGFKDSGDLEATTESYERRFRDILIDSESSIDVLSCTTTMEVGIDIGSLVAVALRNMPPSRHNYQQRAGRSGRRGSSVSTVITFAQNNAHDSHLFENPAELIAGQPHLNGLDVENPALVRRHAYAELLQEFFEDTVIRRAGGNVFATLGETLPFYRGTGDGSLASLKGWLDSDPIGAATLQRIQGWLPPGAGLTADECKKSLLDVLEALRSHTTATLPKGDEQLIEFLFSHGVLPSYAFPRDLVAIQIEKPDCTVIEKAQQGAHVALSEYAPGRLVVINKETYRVAAVTANLPATEVNRARPLFQNPAQYLQCPNCLYTASPTNGQAGDQCPVCALARITLVTTIQPEIVWPEGGQPISDLDDDQTITETTVAQLPVPASDTAFEVDEPFGPQARLLHGRQVPLVIMNRGELGPNGPSGFQVCELCGSTPAPGQMLLPNHPRHYSILRRGQPIPARCNGTARSVYLGYEFRTDVLLLRTPLLAPFINDLANSATWPPLRAALASLSNGLALAAASVLDVDPRELQAGYRIRRTASGASLAEVYIYDTLSGGAGYARLIGQKFRSVFDSLKKRLAGCACESSCNRCLRTYSNRMIHSTLDRHLALDMAAYLESVQAPRLYRPSEQKLILEPIKEFLELNNWSVGHGSSGEIIASKTGPNRRIFAAPSLFDINAGPVDWRGGTVLRTFDIEKDFPTAISTLPIS